MSKTAPAPDKSESKEPAEVARIATPKHKWRDDGFRHRDSTPSRCTRTIYDAADVDLRSLPRDGTHHNALDDAIYQARAVQLAMTKLRVAA